jgi:AbrB family looped-hinge helix DNA binding protein
VPKSTITSKGQITIPKTLRDRFGLEPGVVLEFVEDSRGALVLRKAAGDDGALGVLRHLAPKRPVSVEEMNEAVRRRVAAKFGPRK